jgi:hypothetical protein
MCEQRTRSAKSVLLVPVWRSLIPNLGPDAENGLQTVVQNENSSIEISFFASELLLRGNSMVVQPHHDAQGNVFCWNGEVCMLSSVVRLFGYLLFSVI